MGNCLQTTTLLLAGCLLAAPPSRGWEQVEEDDGITVWVREVPDSDVREVKASTIVDVPASRVWEVLLDTMKYREFMPYIVETRILGKHATGQYEYQRIDPPIVDMRDYAIKVVWEKDEANGVYKRSWSPANEKVPERDDCVRVKTNQGSWTVTVAGPKKAHVEYHLYTNPGGSIPDWMANKANTTSVPTLLDAVRRRSIDPTWKRDD